MTSLVYEANSRANIYDALKLVGFEVPYGLAGKKIHCPLGDINHSDGGEARAARIYSDEKLTCFACGRSYRPVALVSESFSIDREDAAQRLLDMIGWKPQSLEEKWDELVNPPAPPVDKEALKATLEMYCLRTVPNWNRRRLEESVVVMMDKLSRVLSKVETEEDSQHWLDSAKALMNKTLEKK